MAAKGPQVLARGGESVTVRVAPRWSDRELSLTFILGHAYKINMLFNFFISVLKQLFGGTFCSFFYFLFKISSITSKGKLLRKLISFK